MPELMIMNGQGAGGGGWAQRSAPAGSWVGLGPALSFTTTLPSWDTGPWVLPEAELGVGVGDRQGTMSLS